MVTIEELDNNKKGSSEVARNARQTHRYLEEIIAPASDLKNGCGLKSETNPHIDGKLFIDRISLIRRKLLKKKLDDISAGRV